MRDQIDTAPVLEAFRSGDECPFCYLERLAEQRTIRYTLGPSASYMEPDVRAETDKFGFCRVHTKKMYDYGNPLGNALILQTHMAGLLEGLKVEVESQQMPEKKPLFGKSKNQEPLSLEKWLTDLEHSCFICNRIDYHMQRYYITFFYLLREEDFRRQVLESKGCCLRHMSRLLKAAREHLPNAQREWFYDHIPQLMLKNVMRVKGDLDHFVEMFDYRHAGGDWKNSRDAVRRTMQKLQGLYPADPPYKQDP